ncbi:MAG: 50S ribosomal protein L9 [Phycisphaerae bacterium]|nr:50S ribosomal protein L9 [Phycisphaerae bacterium]
MARPIELLLLRNVENLGIVGDVVSVKAGFARNYLLPHAIAEHPTPEKIDSLKDARAAAQADLAALRKRREETVTKLVEHKITLVRSCNDQGLLYGSITQRDIADALVAEGFAVDMRAVRLAQPFRRIGSYHCLIQFERDLKADLTIDVKPDRMLESMMEAERAEAAAKDDESAAADHEDDGDAPKAEKPAKGEKSVKGEKTPKGEKAAKGDYAGDKAEKSTKIDKASRWDNDEKPGKSKKPDGKPEGKPDGKPEAKAGGDAKGEGAGAKGKGAKPSKK